MRAMRSASGGPSSTGSSWRSARTQTSRMNATRLLGAEFADRETVLAGLCALREQIADITARLDAARELEPSLAHRATVLAINQSLARRMLQAHLDWLDEVQEKL
jgi:hypothetical protein